MVIEHDGIYARNTVAKNVLEKSQNKIVVKHLPLIWVLEWWNFVAPQVESPTKLPFCCNLTVIETL